MAKAAMAGLRWIRPRPDLLQPVDFKTVERLLGELSHIPPRPHLVVAAAGHITARLMLAYIEITGLAPELAACRAMAIAELVTETWQRQPPPPRVLH